VISVRGCKRPCAAASSRRSGAEPHHLREGHPESEPRPYGGPAGIPLAPPLRPRPTAGEPPCPNQSRPAVRCASDD
jgi:hypothetical protein